jgi:hypothetical protein
MHVCVSPVFKSHLRLLHAEQVLVTLLNKVLEVAHDVNVEPLTLYPIGILTQ